MSHEEEKNRLPEHGSDDRAGEIAEGLLRGALSRRAVLTKLLGTAGAFGVWSIIGEASVAQAHDDDDDDDHNKDKICISQGELKRIAQSAGGKIYRLMQEYVRFATRAQLDRERFLNTVLHQLRDEHAITRSDEKALGEIITAIFHSENASDIEDKARAILAKLQKRSNTSLVALAVANSIVGTIVEIKRPHPEDSAASVDIGINQVGVTTDEDWAIIGGGALIGAAAGAEIGGVVGGIFGALIGAFIGFLIALSDEAAPTVGDFFDDFFDDDDEDGSE